MENFERYIDDEYVLKRLGEIKRKNKENLAKVIFDNQGIKVDSNSIFDVQVKRIHAYKRQTLNCLRIMELYNSLLENPNLDIAPRTFIFAGKAAPAYYLAKLIRVTDDLINGVYSKDRDKFRSVYDNLLTYNDEFFVLKDFDSYLKAQDKVDLLYRNNKEWQRKCGVNIAHSGIFSSDRTIAEYVFFR